MLIRIPLLPKWIRWGSVVVVAAVIIYKSLLMSPPDTVPVAEFSLEDEWLHLVAYGGLAGVLSYALFDSKGFESPRRRADFVFSVTVGLGLLIEFAQGFIPERYMALDDAVANILGVTLSIVWYVIERHAIFMRFE
jgi:VanZ family protein